MGNGEKSLPYKSKKFKPYVIVKDGIIKKVSSNFIKLINYDKQEIEGKSIEEVFKLIRIYPEVDENDLFGKKEYFIFDSMFKVRVVTIIKDEMKKRGEYVYTFIERNKKYIRQKLSFFERIQFYSDNSLGIAFFSYPDFILLKANKNFYKYLYESTSKRENLIGKKIKNEIEANYNSSFWGKIWECILKTGEGYNVKEYRHIKSNGDTAYYNIQITPIKEKKEIKCCIVSIKDITDDVLKRKELERQASIIKQQRDELEAIIKNISDGIAVVDKELNYELLNDTIKEIFYDFDSIKRYGDSLKNTKYYDKDGNIISFENFIGCRVLRGERIENFLQIIKRPDRTVYVSTFGSPIYDKNGEIAKAVLCFRDITEQINYEEILKTQMEHFYKIIDSLELPLVRITYPDFVIIEMNKRAKEFIKEIVPRFHMNLDMIKEDHILKYFPIDYKKEETYIYILEMEKNKNPVKIENVEIIKKDKKIYSNLIFQPILNSSGEIYEILMIIIDITHEVEEKEAIAKLLKMQGEIFSFITHEFKTPLSIISAAVQAMEFLCKDELSERAKGYIKRIKQSCLQQLRLVNNLLDIVRADAGYLKVYKKNIDIVKLTRYITESVSIYAKQKDINIHFISDTQSKIIAIDDEKYERILLNLLSNAIKYTQPKKNIFVNISTIENSICLEVKDEGIGIPKDKQDIVFQRFGQIDNSLSRSCDGTGIGLCLTKLFVDALGGRIELISNEGKGSSFKIYLPDFIIELEESKNKQTFEDSRLIQNVNIEFSNIYCD
ncbi:PAS domain S-box-containing protein [Caloramator quimbayensis]|uniref:histidine kinase n=1 Tax=Caloramator quimbayensis TaxID=1147123 RepID=A0A1T4Y565_9CLOT|nr:PAS domain-containing sensor histidine kinase [Caloramator quimbayensis]SKA96435.1 PAS domain S-box-containing protein [Caloramator quimbayensis]